MWRLNWIKRRRNGNRDGKKHLGSIKKSDALKERERERERARERERLIIWGMKKVYGSPIFNHWFLGAFGIKSNIGSTK